MSNRNKKNIICWSAIKSTLHSLIVPYLFRLYLNLFLLYLSACSVFDECNAIVYNN